MLIDAAADAEKEDYVNSESPHSSSCSHRDFALKMKRKPDEKNEVPEI